MNTIPLNVDISFNKIIDLVKSLSPQEKQLINDAIWDESMPIPKAHKAIVKDRVLKSKQNPERMLNWDDVANTLG
jgi:hypothetical protein